ncbi:hypothetical protein BDN70DRAFT_654246 [Pholiota conissans]|uniref:Heterokaryon incompatibility domain-containing protein n=1 Tax=Pholiota conissans TaxID=109636 RepID=A0A9P5YKG8_9AGAR|nr:hypothetical protein BDN70DRAFT_654246 [Pholiota conissans]
MSEKSGGPKMGPGRVNMLTCENVEVSKRSEKPTDEPEEMVIFRSENGLEGKETPLKKVLTNLREHVFNQLPIRLLCFHKSKLDKSKLTISLLERAEVYSYLEQNFREHMTRHDEIPAAFVVPRKYHPIAASKYAILSHTWLQSSAEVTYDNWKNGDDLDLSHKGYQKLVNFCRIAEAEYNVTLGWMDTVCIDKSSSSELDESIRSMYKWYEEAEICITYLADSSSVYNMVNDRWFTRGWTLQELLAPECLNFYTQDWKRLTGPEPNNDKKIKEIQEIIFNATGIARHHIENLGFASIPTKMQWAAKRQVTRDDDAVYSLMGLFGVSMSIAYGEGPKRAFSRLVNEIINVTPSEDILDIFNFGGGPRIVDKLKNDILPLTPKLYLNSSNLKFSRGRLIKPLVMTHLGLRIPVLLLKAALGSSSSEKYTSIGDYFANINYITVSRNFTTWSSRTSHLNILDILSQKVSLDPVSRYFQVAVLNCAAAPDIADIHIPEKCLAVIYLNYSSPGKEPPQIGPTTKLYKIATKAPVIFNLKNHKRQPVNGFYTIPRSELAHHGMQFLTMYL